MSQLVKLGYHNREVLVPFYELLTGPAQHILDRCVVLLLQYVIGVARYEFM